MSKIIFSFGVACVLVNSIITAIGASDGYASPAVLGYILIVFGALSNFFVWIFTVGAQKSANKSASNFRFDVDSETLN